MKHTAKSSIGIKKNLLKTNYSEQREEWKGVCYDDRRLYCDIFDMLTEALDDMQGVENNWVWAAFNEQFSKELKMLDQIKTNFAA